MKGMTSRLTRFFAAALTCGLLGAAQAQVGGQAAPLLAQPLFKEAGRGPAGAYTLPGGVSVLLNQNKGFLLSATVLTKYEAPSGLEVSGGTPAAQGASSQGTTGTDTGITRAANAVGVLSGFGEGLAQPLAQFLNRPDVGPRLGQGFSIKADPFVIGAKLEGGILKLTISPSQVAGQAFATTRNALPAKKATAKPVVLRVYSDFQCPYCLQFETQTLPALLAKLPDDVRIEFHQFPLESIHPLARPSAEASECAAQQDKFWTYKDALFTDRSWLVSNPREVFLRLAGKVGLDNAAFQKCLDSNAGKAAVDAGLAEAARLGLNGTPTVFINGFQARNPYDLPGLLNLIDFARVAGTLPEVTPTKP